MGAQTSPQTSPPSFPMPAIPSTFSNSNVFSLPNASPTPTHHLPSTLPNALPRLHLSHFAASSPAHIPIHHQLSASMRIYRQHRPAYTFLSSSPASSPNSSPVSKLTSCSPQTSPESSQSRPP